jgi:GDPmannose 4,6-dehydratase
MKINKIQDIKHSEGTVIFVTGVTGQDGSYMVDYLLRETSALIVGGARRLSVENHDNIKHLENEPRFQLVNFDLTDSHSIYKIIEYVKPDYFINFAAQSFVASSWDFARQTWECNSTAVLDCLEAIRQLRPSCRFYNAGSSEEFGNVVYEPQDENHPLRPRSPYGASKAAARTLVKVYRESYGLYAVQGWLFNHEGPRRGEEFVTRKITKGVANIFDAIINNKPIIPIELGNLDTKRDWSDAEDMMDAVWKMLNQDKYNMAFFCRSDCSMFPSQIGKHIKDYVVGSGENHTIREFIEKGFDLVGIKGYWNYIPDKPESEHFSQIDYPDRILVKINPKFYRPAEVDILRANSDKIKKELGWQPKITFDGMIEKMITNDLKKFDT